MIAEEQYHLFKLRLDNLEKIKLEDGETKAITILNEILDSLPNPEDYKSKYLRARALYNLANIKRPKYFDDIAKQNIDITELTSYYEQAEKLLLQVFNEIQNPTIKEKNRQPITLFIINCKGQKALLYSVFYTDPKMAKQVTECVASALDLFEKSQPLTVTSEFMWRYLAAASTAWERLSETAADTEVKKQAHANSITHLKRVLASNLYSFEVLFGLSPKFNFMRKNYEEAMLEHLKAKLLSSNNCFINPKVIKLIDSTIEQYKNPKTLESKLKWQYYAAISAAWGSLSESASNAEEKKQAYADSVTALQDLLELNPRFKFEAIFSNSPDFDFMQKIYEHVLQKIVKESSSSTQIMLECFDIVSAKSWNKGNTKLEKSNHNLPKAESLIREEPSKGKQELITSEIATPTAEIEPQTDARFNYK